MSPATFITPKWHCFKKVEGRVGRLVFWGILDDLFGPWKLPGENSSQDLSDLPFYCLRSDQSLPDFLNGQKMTGKLEVFQILKQAGGYEANGKGEGGRKLGKMTTPLPTPPKKYSFLSSVKKEEGEMAQHLLL